MKAVRYKSSDGLEIPAYITLPKGVPAKNLAVVIFPHGGPWARDSWGYNPFAQFWANRGYAVLQPNFRGSTGYGKKFIDAGNKQWGDKMQDDITWGVTYLVGEGIADPKRVGIMGGSYGGYATLAGVTFTPDLYAAAVDYVGPSNLSTLLETIPPYWEAGRQLFYQRMGDPNTGPAAARSRASTLRRERSSRRGRSPEPAPRALSSGREGSGRRSEDGSCRSIRGRSGRPDRGSRTRVGEVATRLPAAR